jgi:NADH-quinone oxidoreductase subunit H
VIGFATSFALAMVILSITMTVVAFGLWFERKFAARMGSRLGPTIVGPFGLLQPFADVVKLLQKEDIVPDNADRALFNMAPLLGAVCALGASAVIPFTPTMIPANLDVGVLFVLAIGAVNVLPVLAAGWASNNKFALLGGMRAVAQAVSYEVPLVLSALSSSRRRTAGWSRGRTSGSAFPPSRSSSSRCWPRRTAFPSTFPRPSPSSWPASPPSTRA